MASSMRAHEAVDHVIYTNRLKLMSNHNRPLAGQTTYSVTYDSRRTYTSPAASGGKRFAFQQQLPDAEWVEVESISFPMMLQTVVAGKTDRYDFTYDGSAGQMLGSGVLAPGNYTAAEFATALAIAIQADIRAADAAYSAVVVTAIQDTTGHLQLTISSTAHTTGSYFSLLSADFSVGPNLFAPYFGFNSRETLQRNVLAPSSSADIVWTSEARMDMTRTHSVTVISQVLGHANYHTRHPSHHNNALLTLQLSGYGYGSVLHRTYEKGRMLRALTDRQSRTSADIDIVDDQGVSVLDELQPFPVIMNLLFGMHYH